MRRTKAIPTKPESFRQGDVLLLKIPNAQARKTPGTRQAKPILAHGEVTGHAHRFEVDGVAGIAAPGTDEVDVVRVARKAATLVHEDHGGLVMRTGSYEVIRQTEFSPTRDLVRVAD